ncbi:MAG: hemolysin family protein [bacterium]
MNTVILVVVLGLLLNAFFSGAEISLFFADRAVLRGKAANGSRGAGQVERFLDRPQWLLATALVGSAISIAAAAVSLSVYCMDSYGQWGALIALAVIAPLFIVFGQILPRSFFYPRANTYAPRMILLLKLFYYLFLPVLVLLMGALRLFLRVAGKTGKEGSFWYTRDELKLLLTQADNHSLMDEESRQMIDRIFEFSETVVEDAMIPLVEVEGVSEDSTIGEVLRRSSRKLYSRYPVWQDRIDNMVGMVEIFDFLEAGDLERPVKEFMKEVEYIPFNKPIDELLFAMQQKNFNFAVVVDEYGGCIGVITREDIVEEIVGEIEDEHDSHLILYRRIDQDRVSISARMEIDDVNEILGWSLPEGDYETLGGFLLSLFKRVPRPGERIRYRDMVFVIKDATPRAIQEVVVEGA